MFLKARKIPDIPYLQRYILHCGRRAIKWKIRVSGWHKSLLQNGFLSTHRSSGFTHELSFSSHVYKSQVSLLQTVSSHHPNCSIAHRSVEYFITIPVWRIRQIAWWSRLFASLLPFIMIPLPLSTLSGQVLPLHFTHSTVLNQLPFQRNLWRIFSKCIIEKFTVIMIKAVVGYTVKCITLFHRNAQVINLSLTEHYVWQSSTDCT